MRVNVDAMPDKLAGCAFSLFSMRGIERVRMDDIASEAGVTKGSLYWHYMEGYKLRALFEPKLCARSAELRSARELLSIVGINR